MAFASWPICKESRSFCNSQKTRFHWRPRLHALRAELYVITSGLRPPAAISLRARPIASCHFRGLSKAVIATPQATRSSSRRLPFISPTRDKALSHNLGSPQAPMAAQKATMFGPARDERMASREVAVKSDFPSGYGGHVPSVRHDVLFRNTAFDREMRMRKTDRNRDTHNSFEEQITGVPCHTKSPLGARRPPTYGTIPHDGTTTMPKPPWAIVTTRREPLTHRTTPPTMKGMEAWQLPMSGSMSARAPRAASLRATNAPLSARSRINEAALNAGSMLATDTAVGPPAAGSPDYLAMTSPPYTQASPDTRLKHPDSDPPLSRMSGKGSEGGRRTASEIDALSEQLREL